MEKETVIEIEFQPVWDKWAWKVMKNKLDPGFVFEYLKNSNTNIIRLHFGFFIDESYLINDIEKEKLEKSIKAINAKYGIKKRWRANFDGKYCFIDDNFSVKWDRDKEYFVDKRKYENGNYFETKTEAEEYAEYMKKKSLEWHEKRDNNDKV